MSAQPILDAEEVLATACRNALAPFVGTFNGRPRAYYQLAEQGAPKPLIVFQLQADITPSRRIGSIGASALVTVRALAESAKAARELLAAASPAMASLAYDGHTFSVRYERSPSIPPLGGTYTSAHIWRISIERS